jgi:hypothetical protein
VLVRHHGTRHRRVRRGSHRRTRKAELAARTHEIARFCRIADGASAIRPR